ncbi:unnamed protein product (macronuclear) [Paramecium tetraurelia]|uniref:AAA+ ATPase domain-containing protein n=1 Tax=Paramecium tetraurelia TaxID=5888 RepID=A0E6D8_PARTE|nr:uncharacterized protein GSPATT00003720001 [Paramecium tetraurelia]CAK90855.1 unnamed protein product [Paramecium tetraurelia]|eukprot:XP_001458252.1 hypothetical protein (macronuclear) [Paramecium tetraurelia strain d4-2]
MGNIHSQKWSYIGVLVLFFHKSNRTKFLNRRNQWLWKNCKMEFDLLNNVTNKLHKNNNKLLNLIINFLQAQKDPYCQQIIETSMIRKIDVGFEDIIGLEHIKNQLEETIILPNLRPDIYTGIRAPPKGILFYGPPGNGKTLLAKAVANQIKCCFFNISASTLVQKHLGEGEKLMRALFDVAFQLQPSVIFVDEIDSILSKRSQNEHEASRRLKTEFLISFDGIQSSDQDRVFLIAATNRPQDIDDAVLRRFTVKILIDQPELKVRVEMVKSLLSKVKNNLTEQQFQYVAEKLQGYSASDIKAVVKEACMRPLRTDRTLILSIHRQDIRAVSKEDFDFALEQVKPTLSQQQYEEYVKNFK